MNLLLLDTSTDILMVGLSLSGRILESIEENGKNHASLLAPRLQALGQESGLSLSDLDGIICSLGPGSFTGLRIGLSTAKGLSESLGIPAAGITNLDAMGWTQREALGAIASVLDARKKRIYGRIYEEGYARSEIFDLTPSDFFLRYRDLPLRIFGPGPEVLFPAEYRSPLWNYSVLLNWLPGLDHLGREALELGRILGPGDGPYYHRFGEEDLGITPKNPKIP